MKLSNVNMLFIILCFTSCRYVTNVNYNTDYGYTKEINLEAMKIDSLKEDFKMKEFEITEIKTISIDSIITFKLVLKKDSSKLILIIYNDIYSEKLSLNKIKNKMEKKIRRRKNKSFYNLIVKGIYLRDKNILKGEIYYLIDKKWFKFDQVLFDSEDEMNSFIDKKIRYRFSDIRMIEDTTKLDFDSWWTTD